jgi:hypothetical protein
MYSQVPDIQILKTKSRMFGPPPEQGLVSAVVDR